MNRQMVNVDQALDDSQIKPYHIYIVTLCTLLMMIDGYELYLVGWILPDLSSSFNVESKDLTMLLTLQQVGMLLGSLLVTPIADALGRRRLLILSLIGLSAFSLFATFSQSLTSFTIWRILAGACAATILPALMVIANETAPAKYRATFTGLVMAGGMAGPLIGAFMQAFILPIHGWRGGMLLAAILPIVVAVPTYFLLPEPLRFLARRNPKDPSVTKQLRALGIEIQNETEIRVDETSGKKRPALNNLRLVLKPGSRAATLFLWAAFFCVYLFISQWTSWSTTLFQEAAAMSWQDIGLFNFIHTTFGILGSLAVGFVLDRFGFRKILPLALICAGASIIAIGVTIPGQTMFIFAGLLGLFKLFSITGLGILAATLYPSEMKATCVGWAYGAGRFGSIVGPVVGATTIAATNNLAVIFCSFAIPMVLAAFFSVLALSGHLTPKNDKDLRDEIA